MATISFGGDAESFMDAPQMQNKGLAETMASGNGSFFAQLLDLIGVHRQVAKGPKESKEPVPGATPTPVATPSVPVVLDDIVSLTAPSDSGNAVYPTDAPMSEFGRKWLQSMSPITKIDLPASNFGK